MKWINFVNRITMCNLKASSHVPSQPPPPPPLPLPLNRPVSKYYNTLCCPSKIVHKHCFQFLLGLTIASREIENNSYAKFDGQKQALWYWKKRLWNRLFLIFPGLCIKTRLSAWPLTGKWFFILTQTRTFLVTLSLAWSPCFLEIRFVVRGAGVVMPRFRF